MLRPSHDYQPFSTPDGDDAGTTVAVATRLSCHGTTLILQAWLEYEFSSPTVLLSALSEMGAAARRPAPPGDRWFVGVNQAYQGFTPERHDP